MPRTALADVRDIIDIDSDIKGEELQAFVKDANLIVDDRLKGQNISDEQLEMIEKWLAAHLVALRDQRIASDSVGASEKVYEGDTNRGGLELTRYGQTAIALDPTGLLKNAPGSIYIKTVNDQDDWDD